MVDLLAEDSAPLQPPTLTELEEARAEAATARRVSVEWLMATDTAPDLEALLAELVSRPRWHQDAACRGVGPDLFFPRRGERWNAAIALCEECSVRSECLASALALEDHEAQGVWGGTTGRGRRQMRRGVA
jgi:WhiB family transcriptional regulator, redox-sensing transcriptional regulator